MTAEILAKRLEGEGLKSYSGIYCDEAGLAFLCAADERTVRRWRRLAKGPRWIQLARIVYDLEEVAAWLNAGGLRKSGEKKSSPVAASGRECPPAQRRKALM